MDMESISNYCICRHPPSRPRATQTDMAFPREGQQAALLKIQEDHIMSTDHSPTDAPSSTALQVSLTFVRRSQFAALVEHTALHQHFLGMQGCSMYADGILKRNRRDCDEMGQTSNSWRQTCHSLQNFSNFGSLRKTCHNLCIHFLLFKWSSNCQGMPRSASHLNPLQHPFNILLHCTTLPYQSI